MAELAAQVDAGLGFACHAFSEPVLRDQAAYAAAEDDLYARLAELARPLRQAGLSRLNVSIDTLDAAKFHAITRRGNLERVLPEGRRAELDWDAWARPPVFEWLARHVDEEEMRRVFNLGIGFCAVVPQAEPGELVIGKIA